MVPPRLVRFLRERFGALRHVPALLRLVWRASPGLTVASVALRLGRAVLPVLALYVGKLILDEVASLRAGGPPTGVSLAEALPGGRLAPLAGFVLAELGLFLLSDLGGRLSTLVDGVLADLYSQAASLRLMRHAASLDLEQLENPAEQDRLERARRQVTGRSMLLGQLLGQAQDLVSAAAFAAGLAALAPSLMLFLLAALVPAFFNELHFNREGYRLAFYRTPERRRVDYLRLLGASVETAKEIKLFGLAPELSRRFADLSARMVADQRDLAIRRTGWGALFAAGGTAAYYAAYAVILWRTVSGELSLGDLVFLAGAFARLRTLIEGLLLGFSQLAGQAQYLDDLFSFLALRPRIASPARPVAIPTPLREGFRFEGVGFRYAGSERWAVRGLDFRLGAGETLALVGENGAGKTTIVKLMARLYDPEEGRVLLEGRDLRDYDLGEVRGRIGVIFQDFVRFDLTAAENVAAGRIEAAADRPRIEAAAAQSLADKVIAGLARGYEQPLGRRFDDGVDLSGGEWQKVALARAYMRGADILVLDEPTAALDARAEYEVFRRFRDLIGGRTAVLISHRFSTVRMADRILVLEDGRIREEGSHQALLARGGRYAELFELQAAGYR